MANKPLTAIKLSSFGCDSEQSNTVGKGIISNGMVLDNAVLNEKLNSQQNLISKEIKRPSLAIYRPGMGLRHRNSPKANVSDEERAPDGEENIEKMNWSSNVNSLDLSLNDGAGLIKSVNNIKISNTTSNKKNPDKESLSMKKARNKRPDQPKYIPKPKIAAQCPSPVPSEGDDRLNSSLNRCKSPLEDNCEVEKNINYADVPGTSLDRNKRFQPRHLQSRKNENPQDQSSPIHKEYNKQFPSSNYTCLVIKPNSSHKRSQEDLNANNVNNLNTGKQSNINSHNSRNSDVQVNNSSSSKSGSNNSRVPVNSKSDLRDNRNSLRKGRRSRRGRDGKSEITSSESSQRENPRYSDDINKPKLVVGNENMKNFDQPIKLPITDSLKKEGSVCEINSSGSSSPSLSIMREESPSKSLTNVTFNSPKGRGRGRTQNAQSVSSENRSTPSEIVVSGRVASSTGTLASLDYDGEGPRPTLIFESSHKILDWNQEVTNEENMRNAAIANNEGTGRRFSNTKRPEYGSLKEHGNRGNRQLSECSNNSDSSSSTVSLRTERPTSEFQQNPPPRFQRNKDNSGIHRQINPMDDANKFSIKNEKGILKVNWDNVSSGNVHNVPSPMTNLHYRRTNDSMPYKTLFDPSKPLVNHSLQSNTIPTYHQPVVPRNLMPGNGYPTCISPGMQNCRLPLRDQYLQAQQPPHTGIKPSSTSYSPYMVHQPPSVFGHIPPNSQIPAPQNGMFPPPYSEAHGHPQDNSNKRIKPIVEKNLCDINLLERELNTFLTKGLDTVDQKALARCRFKIQLRYENIILADPRFCADRNIESALWKSAFHQVIEAYRKLRDIYPNRQEEFNKAIINLVEEGTVFYESLLEKQQETFGINFSQYLDNDSLTRPMPLDSVKIILISTQKLFICLGDLARYREHSTNTSNYGKARSWYMKAQQIAPKNGRPYNQLAVLAICARRKLDAVYFYMRSLAASNPFLSARESLLGLFDEARKKYEVVEKKKLDEKIVSEKSDKRSKQWRNKNNDRQEVWIHPSGIQHSKTDESVPSENGNEISTVELNKRFVLSFLHVHGKLFTKVGMENFTETANQMLQEFRNLLQCSPAPLASVRLLQLLAINMFSVANASTKSGPPMDSSERPLLQEQALQVSLAMMAIVIERSIILLKEHLGSEDYPAQLISYDLAQLLPTVKIFTDWMSCQRNLWSPPPTLGDLRTGCKGDIWTLYANLLNELKKMKDSGIELKNTKLEGYEPITLPEDVSLACFVPLLGAPQNPYYGQPPLDKERARTWLRVIRVLFFGDYLCGISPPYLKFDVQTTSYVSLITSHSEENTESSEPNTTYNSSEEDDAIEDLPEDYDEEVPKSPLDDTSDIGELWHRQEALKRKKDREDRRKERIQQVLRDHRTKRPMEIQVTPKYLIPDTNCFIDHLLRIDLLLKSKTYNLVVPLIVINELDGLALGERPHSSSGFYQRASSPTSNSSLDHHQQRARQVGQAAKDAVSYLEESFASRELRLKAITSKGNLLDSISIRSEDTGEKRGNNDDLILSCCLHYCDGDKASEYMPKDPDGPIHITREVVLLTDDRNLRVKAMTHNVPTRSLDEFLRWARIR